MSLTYSQVGDIYPNRGDPRLARLSELFRRAASEQIHALLVDDSQAGIGGAFGGYSASLMLALNQASGTKIPGTPWMPCKARSGTGGFYPASQSFRNVNNIGTIDISKYPPGFAGTGGAAIPHDVNSGDLAFNILVQGDCIRFEENLDVTAWGLTDLISRDDTSWYTEVILGRCDNANIHGGTAGAEVLVEAWRGSNADMSWGSGSAAQVLSSTSSGLALNTGTVDDPVLYRAGPIAFGASPYISVTWRSTAAGSKIRVAGARVWNTRAPGWFVHTIQEGGYRTIDASSWYATHGNSGPFLQKMFSAMKNGIPDVIFFGLGTNDIGSGKSAANWKADFVTWCNWIWGIFGTQVPIVVICEPFRGDAATAGYAAFMTEMYQQIGAVCELIDAGFGGAGNLFAYNNILNISRYYGLQDSSVLTGKTYLGDFTQLVQAAGSVAITANTHIVSTRRQGYYQHWLFTGTTTTIGAGGAINSERYGPGGDLYNAGADAIPSKMWTPILPLFGRQGNVGPGLPNDFVHFCPGGSQALARMFVTTLVGAAASAPRFPTRLVRA